MEQQDNHNYLMSTILFVKDRKIKCDITFFDDKPLIDVEISSIFLDNDNSCIILSNNQRIVISEILFIVPIIPEKLSYQEDKDDFLSVKLFDDDNDNEFLNDSIIESYYCQTKEQKQWALHRYWSFYS